MINWSCYIVMPLNVEKVELGAGEGGGGGGGGTFLLLCSSIHFFVFPWFTLYFVCKLSQKVFELGL